MPRVRGLLGRSWGRGRFAGAGRALAGVLPRLPHQPGHGGAQGPAADGVRHGPVAASPDGLAFAYSLAGLP